MTNPRKNAWFVKGFMLRLARRCGAPGAARPWREGLPTDSRPCDSAGPFVWDTLRTLSNQENSRSVSRYDDSTFRDRLTLASEARQTMLAKFKQPLDPGTPAAMEKRRERESIAAARAECNAKRETACQKPDRELARQATLAAQTAAEAERAAVRSQAVWR